MSRGAQREALESRAALNQTRRMTAFSGTLVAPQAGGARRQAAGRRARGTAVPTPASAGPAAPPAASPGRARCRRRARRPAADARRCQVLTPASDFKPFMARGVTPDVRNAAVKKLFADPHFNVMDRLDIYIDDYSQPDPLPAAMLRQMASAQFLKLFDDDETPAANSPRLGMMRIPRPRRRGTVRAPSRITAPARGASTPGPASCPRSRRCPH